MLFVTFLSFLAFHGGRRVRCPTPLATPMSGATYGVPQNYLIYDVAEKPCDIQNFTLV